MLASPGSYAGNRRGRLIVKTQPVPGTSLTLNEPPSASTFCLAMERPNPNPVLSSLRCMNGLNIVSALSLGSPPQ